jgi:putative sigma-54 modulation protein
MNVQIRTVHFDADTKLIDHVNTKIEKLTTFHDKIISAEVYLKLDNLSQNIRDKVAEIKIHVPKHSYFVKHQSKTFEQSFDLAFDSLVNQVKRQKEKQILTQR